ncbi:hypothetical protein CsatB_026677 [Cannabis sativa]
MAQVVEKFFSQSIQRIFSSKRLILKSSKLKMSIYMNRLLPRSNTSFLLRNGNALQAKVLRLREETFMVDSGVGPPKICTRDELTRVPVDGSTRFENVVGYVDVKAGESQIKKQMLERFFVDVVAGESQIKERAAARFNDMVGSMAGESIVLPRRFRQNRAWLELNKMSRTNAKVKGFIVEKVRGGYSVAIAGFIAFLPFRVMMNQKLNDRFTIESINPKSKQIVVFF